LIFIILYFSDGDNNTSFADTSSSIIPDDSPFPSSLLNDDDDINDADEGMWDLHFALVIWPAPTIIGGGSCDGKPLDDDNCGSDDDCFVTDICIAAPVDDDDVEDNGDDGSDGGDDDDMLPRSLLVIVVGSQCVSIIAVDGVVDDGCTDP
jgi:hypothetical protein